MEIEEIYVAEATTEFSQLRAALLLENMGEGEILNVFSKRTGNCHFFKINSSSHSRWMIFYRTR